MERGVAEQPAALGSRRFVSAVTTAVDFDGKTARNGEKPHRSETSITLARPSWSSYAAPVRTDIATARAGSFTRKGQKLRCSVLPETPATRQFSKFQSPPRADYFASHQNARGRLRWQ